MEQEYPNGATPLGPDEREGLRLSHITTREELNRWEHRNILEAHQWLAITSKTTIIDEGFLRTLHKKMFGKVWDWAGHYRRSNKNIGVDWHRIPESLRQMLDDVIYWIDNESYMPEEIAARFHHRLVYIHLFPNGNGRHARLASDHFLNQQWGLEPFTWGSGNLEDPGEVRRCYIDALRAADGHNYQPLLEFVRS